jgi:exosortase
MIETLPPTPAHSQPVAAGEGNLPAPRAGGPTSWIRRLTSPRYVAPAVVVVVLGFAYAPNLRQLYSTWNTDPNYSHGFLVVPVALFILWRRWTEAAAPAVRPSPWGWAALGVVLVLRAFFYEYGYDWSETATLLPAVACLTLAAGGWPLLRTAWPAIAFLVFLFPLPTSINGILSQPLQRLATLGTSALLKSSGMWALTEGNVLVIGADPLEVAAACNGLSMLMCLSATVAAMIIVIPIATWKKVALLASIIPIALISNILRITATAWCYHLFGAKVGGHFAHDAAGWLMMPMALALVALELALLSWLIVAVEEVPLGRPDKALRRQAVRG